MAEWRVDWGISFSNGFGDADARNRNLYHGTAGYHASDHAGCRHSLHYGWFSRERDVADVWWTVDHIH